MAYTGGKKIADAAIKNRKQTPLVEWIRKRALAWDRDVTKTPPAGPPTPDGKSEYLNPSRFPNTQSARTNDPPTVPGGIHHRLADNYYYERDARRMVLPPSPVYKTNAEGSEVFRDEKGEEVDKNQLLAAGINKGPTENFGFKRAPTPGFGYEWSRNIDDEQWSQKKDPVLRKLEKYDRYSQMH